jgi:hypothetical protein
MEDWLAFTQAMPDLAAFGRERLERRISYLATLRADGSPRVHPVSPFFAGGHLYVYMEPTSPKVHDIRRDPRYALHCAISDNSGGEGEFLISGSAREITDEESRGGIFEGARAAGYTPQDRYIVFEFGVTSAMATTYEGGAVNRLRWQADNQ